MPSTTFACASFTGVASSPAKLAQAKVVESHPRRGRQKPKRRGTLGCPPFDENRSPSSREAALSAATAESCARMEMQRSSFRASQLSLSAMIA